MAHWQRLFSTAPSSAIPASLPCPGAQEGSAGAGAGAVDAVDALDSSRVAVPAEILAAWQDEGAAERLRNRFVTGGWWG